MSNGRVESAPAYWTGHRDDGRRATVWYDFAFRAWKVGFYPKGSNRTAESWVTAATFEAGIERAKAEGYR